MIKTNPNGDKIIRPFPGDTHDETFISGEGSMPPDGSVADSKTPVSKPLDSTTWIIRLKRQWKSMLAWLARGAEHSCPT